MAQSKTQVVQMSNYRTSYIRQSSWQVVKPLVKEIAGVVITVFALYATYVLACFL